MKTLPAGYRFIDYGSSLIDQLIDLDFRASQRFRDHGYPYLADARMRMGDWQEKFSGSDIWIIAHGKTLVGYAAGFDLGELYWIKEVGVDPDHGQKGLGTALVGKAIARANWAYHSAIGLSTFREIPFNEPFYSKLGFLTVPKGERGSSQNSLAQQQFWTELDDDTLPAARILMLKRL